MNLECIWRIKKVQFDLGHPHSVRIIHFHSAKVRQIKKLAGDSCQFNTNHIVRTICLSVKKSLFSQFFMQLAGVEDKKAGLKIKLARI
jgi:hypothetical protein